VLYWNLLCKVE